MAKDRVQVQALPGPQPITPRAAPVDIYHRPDVQGPPRGPSEMDQLVGALSDLQPTINQYASIKHAEDVQQQMSEGEKAVLADKRLQNRSALREAVANGSIPAARNPWFLQGARQQVYRLQGETFDRDLREAYAQSDARNGDDIAGFVSSFTQEYLKNNEADPADPEMAKILTPAIERSQANLFNHHRAERDQAIEKSVIDNTDREIGMLLDRSEELATVPEVAGPMIQNILDEQYKNGLSGTVSNEIAAKAIARKAELSLDPSYLDVLDNVTVGKGTLGQIGWVKDLRHDTEAKINQQVEQNDRISAKQNKQQTEDATKDLLTEGFNSLIDNPTADIKDTMRSLALVDPEAAQKLYGWQQSQINGQDKLNVDESMEVALTAKVFAGNGDMREVINAHRAGLISTDTAKKLAENLDRSKEFRSPLKDPTVSELHRNLGVTIRGSDANFKEVDAINAGRAQNQFLEALIKYKKTNPQATELEVMKYGTELQQTLLGIYAKDASADAKDSVDLNPESALVLPPDSVDWSKKPIFATREELVKAAQDYNAGLPNSVFERLAAHLQVEPQVLLKVQARLLANPPTKKK